MLFQRSGHNTTPIPMTVKRGEIYRNCVANTLQNTSKGDTASAVGFFSYL